MQPDISHIHYSDYPHLYATLKQSATTSLVAKELFLTVNRYLAANKHIKFVPYEGTIRALQYILTSIYEEENTGQLVSQFSYPGALKILILQHLGISEADDIPTLKY